MERLVLVMTDPVIRTVPLGNQWPTVDPFLFCAHHRDSYPAGDDRLGPDAALDGRDLGADFAGIDGWRMYHGRAVPGFPQHPHRGFETVTLVRRGLVDHADSLGAAARFGPGDAQWVTAGSGIVHSEMFPLLGRDRPNPFELFQIWLNLPAADKMTDPNFTMLWSEDIPRVTFADTARRGSRRVEIEVVAGSIDGVEPLSPPPNSWAARDDADVAIWAVRMDAGANWTMPAARSSETVRTVYGFAGEGCDIGGHRIGPDTGAIVHADAPIEITAGNTDVELLVLQGRPISEPVAQYGPFVMNDRAGIEQAVADYQRTGFGGWPWPTDDPVHGRDEPRFARHADGRSERISA